MAGLLYAQGADLDRLAYALNRVGAWAPSGRPWTAAALEEAAR